MKINVIDSQEVLAMYVDESQDPAYIAKELGMSLEKVIQILNHLQKEEEISGFEKIEVTRRHSAKNENTKLLELHTTNIKDELDINKRYDTHHFIIDISKAFIFEDHLIVPFELDINKNKYHLTLILTNDGQVSYGTKTKSELEKLKTELGNKWSLLNETTEQIIVDNLLDSYL